MSARTKFVPGGMPAPGQLGNNNASESAIQSSSSDKSDSTIPALKDASNSPRPGRKSIRNSAPDNKGNNDIDSINTSSMQPPASALTMTGSNNPLNTAYLIGSKANRSGGGTPGQNKKGRNAIIENLKENDPVSRIRSPKPIPMSTRHLQNSSPAANFLFSSANAPLLGEDHAVTSPPNQRQASRAQSGSAMHMPADGQRANRSSMNLSRNSFAASGHTLMNGFSPSPRPPRNESLEPATREVFPMRSHADGSMEEAHTFNSLSPPEPPQHFFENRSYEFQAPIKLDGHDDDSNGHVARKQEHRVLRRTTKRIVHDGDEDEAVNIPEGKRAKIDMRSKEVEIEQIDLTYTHPARPDRTSTPAPRFTTPVHDPYNHRQPTPHPHHETHVPQSTMQYGEDNQALCRLLGVDFDQYLAEHIENYEASKKRWTSCSIDEWTGGAEEMSGKFNKLIDFVKEHMTAKLSLYASLHGKVAQHKVTLSERKSMLKSMQEKLVKDSGTVLGGAMNGAG